jgi:ankyrin repeat protein
VTAPEPPAPAPPVPAPPPTEAALLDAAREGRLADADALLAADPALAGRARDAAGDSAVLVAAFRGHRAVAERVAQASGGAGLTPWDAALVGDAAALAAHLDRDPGLAHARHPDGWPLLHLAGFYGHPAVVDLLVARGASVHARSANRMDNTALHAAVAMSGHAGVVDRLLAHGAAVDAAGAGGYTPLHLAASRGDLPSIDRLLARGADPRAHTDEGQTPADVARARGHAAAAERLDAAGAGTG